MKKVLGLALGFCSLGMNAFSMNVMSDITTYEDIQVQVLNQCLSAERNSTELLEEIVGIQTFGHSFDFDHFGTVQMEVLEGILKNTLKKEKVSISTIDKNFFQLHQGSLNTTKYTLTTNEDITCELTEDLRLREFSINENDCLSESGDAVEVEPMKIEFYDVQNKRMETILDKFGVCPFNI